MHAAIALALGGLAAALPQATTTSSAPPQTTTVGPAFQRSKNFTVSIGSSDDSSLVGFVLQQAHLGAGQNALVFQRPSTYTGYVSYLEGPDHDVPDGHAFLQQYLPGAPSPYDVYGVKMPSVAPKPGEVDIVTGEPGDQTEAFGITTSPTDPDHLFYYTFEKNTTFYACSDSIGDIKDTLFLKYGYVEPGLPPAGCNVIDMYVTYL